jgi:hypothetical protein
MDDLDPKKPTKKKFVIPSLSQVDEVRNEEVKSADFFKTRATQYSSCSLPIPSPT